MIDCDYSAEHRKFQVIEQLPALLTPKEVMDILGVGKNTVYRMLNSGELHGIRIGRNWRISADHLQAFTST